MSPLPVSQVLLLLVGATQAMLALTVLVVLFQRHRSPSVYLWSGGSLAMALAVLLLAWRGQLPDWLSFELMALLYTGALGLRILALRLDLGWPLHLKRAAGLIALIWITYTLAYRQGGLSASAPLGTVVVAMGSAWLAWHAAAVGRALRSLSAQMMAVSVAVLALVLLCRLLATALGWLDSAVLGVHWSTVLVMMVAVTASVFTNLGYLGMALDRASLLARKAQQAELAALKQRDSAEDDARALRQLLDERDRLSAQRDQLLQVLAHEINQPLHNAGGVLQALDDALHSTGASAGALAAQRLQQALTVLSGVRSVLDNTLAAASLLARDTPIHCQEVELDFLIELTLGDLPAAQRALVSVARHTTLQQVDVEPGLMRLALRNLLVNALHHGGQGAVRIELDETHEPPALQLTVVDDGPGAPQLMPGAPAQALPAGGRGPSAQGQGLGLVLARRVMDLHGGTLQLRQNQPRGLRATLNLPLPG